MKKLFSILALFAFWGVQGFAQTFEADGIYYNVTDEAAFTCEVTSHPDGTEGYSGDIVIPASVQYNEQTYAVTRIGDNAFADCSILNSVVIPEGVTRLGSHAFARSSVVSVSLPQTLTDLGYASFTRCANLTDITLPPLITELSTWAFDYCTSLRSIVIPENVTTIGSSTFAYCTSLSSAQFPEGLQSIGNDAFSGSIAILTFLSNIPPTFSDSYSGTLIVPAAALQAYCDAYSQIDASSIISSARQMEWDVTVSAEGNSSALQKAINGGTDMEDLLAVISLKITGTINSYDFMVMRNKMVNLRHLDLSKVDVVYNAYEHYTGYHSEDDKIPAYAFYEKRKMQNCVLPESINTIGYNAFCGTSLNGELIIPDKVEYIDGSAFDNCSNLESIKFLSEDFTNPDNAGYIGRYAFGSCSNLKSVTFSNSLKTIGYGAFSSCSQLKEVVFGNSLKRIEYDAFRDSGIETLKLPINLEYIGYRAFYNCSSLKEIRIPSSVRTLEDNAFNTGSIKDVYTYTIDPLAMGQNTFASETFSGATLHVPETAYWNYYWNTQWSQFLNITQFNEPYEYFYLDKDFTMEPETPRLDGTTDETTGEEDAPDADFNAGSGFIVEGDEVQDLGEVHIKNDGNGNGGSVIGNGNHGHGNIHAKNVHIDIEVVANRWYFFCFPYQIDKTNIKYKGNYVLRYYDGEVRAENGSGGWTDVAADYLERGVGYIFQGDKTGTLTFKIADVQFDGEDRAATLANHSAATAQDAGWNFIGNPHTAYFDVQDLDYEYPITVWNGSSYNAINPTDDELVLHPYQAFFVQKPNGKSEINFGAAHRQTKIQTESAANAEARAERRMAKRMANVHRQLVNLTIGSNDSTTADRTRVVFNEESRMEYETERDAAKFMADGVAQLYTTDSKNVKYAINERPTDNGFVTLAYVAPAAGSYTIGVTRADVGVVLKDKVTGASHDFAKGSYTFTTEAGTFEERFMLVKAAETTAVDGVFAAGNAVVDVHDGCITVRGAEQQTTTVAALNGSVVGTLQGNGSLNVQPGVYVISVGKHVQKFMVK